MVDGVCGVVGESVQSRVKMERAKEHVTVTIRLRIMAERNAQARTPSLSHALRSCAQVSLP